MKKHFIALLLAFAMIFCLSSCEFDLPIDGENNIIGDLIDGEPLDDEVLDDEPTEDEPTEDEPAVCEHIFGDFVIEKDSTCTEEGVSARICSVCGEKETKTIALNDHNEICGDYKAPSCTEEGHTESIYCSDCGEVFVHGELIPTIPHEESEWIVDIPPKKNADGKKHTECAVCGMLMSESVIPATGSIGLEYEIYENDYCIITGIGTCTDTDIYITEYMYGYYVGGIETNAFYGNDTITSVSINCSGSIEYNAFAFCKNLKNIAIGPYIQVVYYSFACGSDVESFYVHDNNQYYKSVDGNVYTKDGAVLLSYATGKSDTKFVVPDSVKKIEESAFYGCDNLTSVVIGNGVEHIERYAFYACSSLVDIKIGDGVSEIGNNAFYNSGYYNTAGNWYNDCLYVGEYLVDAKKDLTGTCVIKNGTRVVANQAFYETSELTEVITPDSLTYIGEFAFSNCNSLAKINISSNIKKIGVDAFYATAYYFNESCWTDGVLYIDGCLINAYDVFGNSVSGDYVILDGTRLIADYSFAACDKITSVVIPKSVKSIGAVMFWHDMENIKIYYTGSELEWKEITIDSDNEALIKAELQFN